MQLKVTNIKVIYLIVDNLKMSDCFL